MGILIRRRRKETLRITHELVRIRGPREAVTGWCKQCSNETKLLPPEDVAILTGISTRQIYQRLEIGQVHFIELSKGSLLICMNSIAEQMLDHAIASPSTEF